MQSRTKFYFLLILFTIKILFPENASAFSSWQLVEKSGYRIYCKSSNMEYALNLASDIEIIFNKTTDVIGYIPDRHLNIYVAEKKFKNNITVLANNIFDFNKIIIFVDDDYNSSINRIWDFTVKKVLAEMNKKSSGFSALKYRSMESWLPGTLSGYLREGFNSMDSMFLTGMLLNDIRLAPDPSLLNNYSSKEREAVYRGFIFYVAKSFGDEVLASALRNISFYGGFIKALENITGYKKEYIVTEFNVFFKLQKKDINYKETSYTAKFATFDNQSFIFLAASEQGKIIIFDKIHKSLEFLELNKDSDIELAGLKSFRRISSFPFNFPEETIQGAFWNNNKAVVSVLGNEGTSFYLFDYIENKMKQRLFLPYLYIREFSGNHLPNSLVFSASEGRRQDIFIFNFDSMSVTKITESRFEYSNPAVYRKDSLIFVEKSDKSRIYKYDFLNNKKVLLWEADGIIKDLTVSANGEIFFSWNSNNTFNIYRFDNPGKNPVQLTYLNTGAFNPLMFIHNRIIINCYIDRRLINAVLYQ